jgi:hypothetical protein
MRVRVVDGATVHECGLCGARFGVRLAIEALDDADAARERGVAREVWPLVRVIAALPGLHVRAAAASDAVARTLPFVELSVTSAAALVQLENLAAALRLAAGSLRLHWILEVEHQHQLVFVLKPRHGGGAVSAAAVRDAAIDVDVLQRSIDGYRRLSWWRHAGDGPNG